MTRPIKKRAPNPKTNGALPKKVNETDLAELVDIAIRRGAEKRRRCVHLRGGICRFRTWRSRKEIHQGAGNPIQNQRSKMGWSVEPSPIWCAFCPTSPELQEIDEYLEDVEDRLDDLTSGR